MAIEIKNHLLINSSFFNFCYFQNLVIFTYYTVDKKDNKST